MFTWLAESALMLSPIGSLLKAIGAVLRRFFSALDLQGWIGLVGIAAMAWIALHQWGEARHSKKQSGQFERLYRGEKQAFDTTVANYRAAAVKAKQDDAANAARVHTEQAKINEDTAQSFEARLAAARATAQRLRDQSAGNPGASGTADVPGLSAPASGTAQASGENGLPAGDALTATEQAIQLDELIKWVRAQAAVDPNKGKPDG